MKASQFYPDEHESRATSGEAYIYEELLQTEGTDVKVRARRSGLGLDGQG